MSETAFWSVVVRSGQALIEASPTLVCGLLVAAVFRRMMGAQGVRRLFGSSGLGGLGRAWGFGMLLPVCSLGVIPVAVAMRRSGVRGGTILAFILAAPLLNPISFLYGLTLSDPIVIISFASGSLLLSLLAGWLWDMWSPAASGQNETAYDEPMPAPGPKRLLAVFVEMARLATSSLWLYWGIGALGSGLLAGVLSKGSLQTEMSHADPWAPLIMTGVAFPAYDTPLAGMMKLGLMFDHGNSVGAAFVLFVLGIGMNLGLLAWVFRTFANWRLVPWSMGLVTLVIGLGYLAEPALYRAAVEITHTHAFDDYSSPFPAVGSVPLEAIERALRQPLEIMEPVALAALGLLLLAGVISRFLVRRYSLDAWLTRQPQSPAATDAAAPWWNRAVPGPVLGLVALLGLILFSVAGAYIYYPPPAQVFSQMGRIKADVFTALAAADRDPMQRQEAIRRIEQWDLLARQLQVGVFIRTGGLPEGGAAAASELRERLEELRDVLLEGDPGDARNPGFPIVMHAAAVCGQVYGANSSPSTALGTSAEIAQELDTGFATLSKAIETQGPKAEGIPIREQVQRLDQLSRQLDLRRYQETGELSRAAQADSRRFRLHLERLAAQIEANLPPGRYRREQDRAGKALKQVVGSQFAP